MIITCEIFQCWAKSTNKFKGTHPISLVGQQTHSVELYMGIFFILSCNMLSSGKPSLFSQFALNGPQYRQVAPSNFLKLIFEGPLGWNDNPSGIGNMLNFKSMYIWALFRLSRNKWQWYNYQYKLSPKTQDPLNMDHDVHRQTVKYHWFNQLLPVSKTKAPQWRM